MIKPFLISFARESLNANGVKNIFIFFRKLEAYVRRVSECHFDTMIWSDCHQRSKHIDIRYHFVRDHVMKKNIDVVHVPFEDNVSDLMTKPFSKIKLTKFKDMLFGTAS